MLRVGQRSQLVVGVLVVLHEHEVPVLQEPLVLAAGQIVGGAEGEAAVDVQLRARSAGADRAGFPEVLRARTPDDPLARHADGEPQLDRLLVGAEPELLVSGEDRHPDVVGVEREHFQGEIPRELDRLGLEVGADREVAEHLEEREVAQGAADVVDVGRAKALLTARQHGRGRIGAAQEVGLQRLHAGGREQNRAIVGGRHQRCGGNAQVLALGEEAEKPLANLIRSHRNDVKGGAHEPRVRQMRWLSCGRAPSERVRRSCRGRRSDRRHTGTRSDPGPCARPARAARPRSRNARRLQRERRGDSAGARPGSGS